MSPYGLGYPGPWMQSTTGVEERCIFGKNGAGVDNRTKSTWGWLAWTSLSVNGYYDMMNRKLELNADGNLHLGRNWVAEYTFRKHTDFRDMTA